MNKSNAWWRGAVVYQIYPRSYCDSNGDGIGDLAGIISKLDYIASLGVDAIWLSPIHPSPNRDFGYDVSDFLGIAPEMGTMADFERLLAEAHKRGLKVILDEVLSHTSDEHPWFLESRSNKTNPKADWYVWADARDDGTPPNNWLAVFGGAAWSYFPARRQYYFHKFLRQQPKLNLRNPDALKAALDVLKFWLDIGVDGFRLDVANSYLHDADLRDNPAIVPGERTRWHWAHVYNQQRHTSDANLPENASVLNAIRELAADYPQAFVFGEFSEEPLLLPNFVGEKHGLHSGYTFTFLEDHSFKPSVFASYYEFLKPFADVWPCVTFSNHDVSRTVTRYGGREGDDALAKLALTLLVSLKGTVLLYQGEELGLGDGPIARHELKDPFGDLYYPMFKGRDPCRTPMPWTGEASGLGFTTGASWLPLAPAHRGQAVSTQEPRADSVLAFARSLLKARKGLPQLQAGELRIVTATDQVLAFERVDAAGKVLCVFNLSREPVVFELGQHRLTAATITCGNCTVESGRIQLAGLSGVVGPVA